jgi:hypothetical protein
MLFRYVKYKSSNDPEMTRNGTKKIMVKPSRKAPKAAFVNESKIISPPPAYTDAIKTIFNTQNGVADYGPKPSNIDSYRTVNGRTYAVVKDESGTQLVPTRSPSAALFNYQMAYNSYN